MKKEIVTRQRRNVEKKQVPPAPSRPTARIDPNAPHQGQVKGEAR